VAPPGNQAANGEHNRHAYSTGRPQSTRQILQRTIFAMLTVRSLPSAQLAFHPVLANTEHQCKMG
jgi:hypothetical protein